MTTGLRRSGPGPAHGRSTPPPHLQVPMRSRGLVTASGASVEQPQTATTNGAPGRRKRASSSSARRPPPQASPQRRLAPGGCLCSSSEHAFGLTYRTTVVKWAQLYCHVLAQPPCHPASAPAPLCSVTAQHLELLTSFYVRGVGASRTQLFPLAAGTFQQAWMVSKGRVQRTGMLWLPLHTTLNEPQLIAVSPAWRCPSPGGRWNVRAVH